jgi:hypothetical protein
MNQIKSIQLGVIAICIATVPLSLAQTPRIRTSGSNQIITTATAAPIRTGSNGNSTRAPQIGINPGNAAITGAIPNIGPHTATNPGVQTGISNHAIGITSAAVGNGGSSGNPTGVTQTGTNAAAGTNMTAKAQTGTDSAVKTTQPQFFIETTQLPTLSTPTPSPTSTPSATPVASLAPATSPSVSPSPTPLL